MQPRLTVGVLVLQAEGLVSAIRYLGFLFQTTPAVIIPKPQEIAVLIVHLTRDADVISVEVAGLLSAFSVFCDHQRRKTQNYRTNQRSTRPGSLLNQICSLSNNTGSSSSLFIPSSGNRLDDCY